MRSRQSGYMIGIGLTWLLIVFGELLWLFDPITIRHTYYWIDLLEYLLILCALPLCFWMVAAVRDLIRDRANVRLSLRAGLPTLMSDQPSRPFQHAPRWIIILVISLRIAVMISAMITILLILFAPQQLLAIGISFGLSLLTVMLEMIAADRLSLGRFRLKSLGQCVAIILLLMIFLFPTQYMVTYPGLTVNMNRYAAVEQSVPHSEQAGSITGVLVFERPAFPIDWLYAQFFEHYEFKRIQPQDPPLGDQLQVVRTLKHHADQVASAYAFKKVGIGAGLTNHGVRVLGMLPHSPAASALQVGDIILGINDQPILTVADLLDVMHEIRPKTPIELQLIRQGELFTIPVETVAAEDDPERSIIGIQIADETRLDLPLEVDYRSYLLHEGGPSHGAMLALAIIDQLTPGGVTNGWHVAGTGTIDSEGNIGKIGGIEQKAYIVERAGVDVFFVPQGQQDDAERGAKHLTIVPVANLEDILQWLEARGISGMVE